MREDSHISLLTEFPRTKLSSIYKHLIPNGIEAIAINMTPLFWWSHTEK